MVLYIIRGGEGPSLKIYRSKNMKYLNGSLVLMVVFSLISSVSAYSGTETQLETDPNKTILEATGSVNQVIYGLFKGLGTATSLEVVSPATSTSSEPSGFGLRFFDLSGLSTNDLGSALKAVVILFINIFLIVINIVAQILKGILSAIGG